jgi:hypothetical protein
VTVPSRASVSVQSFGIRYRNPGLPDAVAFPGGGLRPCALPDLTPQPGGHPARTDLSQRTRRRSEKEHG